MKKLLFTLSFILFIFNAKAQSTAYIKVANHGVLEKIEKVSSGGYITIGYDSVYKQQIIRWNDQFSPMWNLKFTDANIANVSQRIVEANDGNFYYMSASSEHTGSTLIVKISSTGSVLWQKNYYGVGGNLNSFVLSKASGSDNGFLFGGGQCILTNYIIKCDQNGAIVWQKQYIYPLSTGVTTCFSIIPEGNNYVVSSSYNINSLLTFKIDANGTVLSHTAYTYTGMQIVPNRLVKLINSNGYALMGGYNNSNDNKTEFVAIFNSQMALLTFNELTVTYTQFILNDVTAINNGSNIIVCGSIYDGSAFYAAMINLSSTGSLVWKKMAEGTTGMSNNNFEFRGICLNGNNTVNTGIGYNEGCVMSIMDASGNGLCNDVPFNLNNIHRTLTLQSSTLTAVDANALVATVNYTYNNNVYAIKEIVCGSLNDVEETKIINTATIYPNPATDNIHIQGIDKSNVTISIYNLNGHKVYNNQGITSEASINITALKSGYYMLRISDKDSYKMLSFVKE